MKKIRVVAEVSFEGIRKGDEAAVAVTPRLKALIARGYLKVVSDGSDTSGLGSDSSGNDGGSEAGADDGIKAGAESGEDSDSG